MTAAFQAYAKGGFTVTASTPRQAGAQFFTRFPAKRKCNIIAGVQDGNFFTVTYGRASEGQWPYSAKDVTKHTVGLLPDGVAA